MKIVSIFAGQLCAFHYENEEFDAYRSILESTEDIDCLLEFFEANKHDLRGNYGKYEFVDVIQEAS